MGRGHTTVSSAIPIPLRKAWLARRGRYQLPPLRTMCRVGVVLSRRLAEIPHLRRRRGRSLGNHSRCDVGGRRDIRHCRCGVVVVGRRRAGLTCCRANHGTGESQKQQRSHPVRSVIAVLVAVVGATGVASAGICPYIAAHRGHQKNYTDRFCLHIQAVKRLQNLLTQDRLRR